MKISDCDAVILAGGQGTRIRHLLPNGHPKAMADINGLPFIARQIAHLWSVGFERFTICTGYGAAVLESYYGICRSTGIPLPLISFSHETQPLGTGGALRQMLRKMRPRRISPLFVCNGDTFFSDLVFERILDEYNLHKQIITSCKQDGKFVGVFVTDWRMKEFLEWEHREKFDMGDLPLHGFSRILEVDTPFLDIGTPEGLAEARERFK